MERLFCQNFSVLCSLSTKFRSGFTFLYIFTFRLSRQLLVEWNKRMTLHFLHINHEIITFMPKTCQGLRRILSQKRKICISSDLLSILAIFLLLICYYELFSSARSELCGPGNRQIAQDIQRILPQNCLNNCRTCGFVVSSVQMTNYCFSFLEE